MIIEINKIKKFIPIIKVFYFIQIKNNLQLLTKILLRILVK